MGTGKGAYLADENRQTSNGRVFSLDCGDVYVYVVLECLGVLGGIHVGALEIVVDVDEVEGATCAGFDESFEVCEAGRAAAVCYGWGAELYFAVIRLHVFLVNGDGVGDGEVGLAGVVGLVGSEQGFCTAFDQDWYGGVPLVIVEIAVDCNGGDVRERLIELVAAVNAPIRSIGRILASNKEFAPG